MSDTKYFVLKAIRTRLKSGAVVTLQAGDIVTDETVTPEFVADALSNECIAARRVTAEGFIENPAKPDGTATRDNENCDIADMSRMPVEAITTACAERALPETASQLLIAFLREQDDEMKAGLEYLAADFADRRELCENLLALDAERRGAKDDLENREAADLAQQQADKLEEGDANTVTTPDGEVVERPKNMMGE